MSARAIGRGTISFGLVSIPVKLYPATSSNAVQFNFLHEKCRSRARQHYFCPKCNQTVERSELVRGYEFAKDQYVVLTDEELKETEAHASELIEIEEFIPLGGVDPLYFEKGYYLGPDKGGEKAYRLLANAMTSSQRVSVARFVMHSKEHLVILRPTQGGLMLHTAYHADEIRPFTEIDRAEDAPLKPGELELACQLIGQLASDSFDPGKYHDGYRERVKEIIQKKIEGQEIATTSPREGKAQVIDLMEALKQSLASRVQAPREAERARPPLRARGVAAASGRERKAK